MLIQKAAKFAAERHTGQTRKYTGEPYFNHCHEVARTLSDALCVVRDPDEEAIAAAYLHDTLEDTDTTYAELLKEFGARVADLVLQVTDVSKPEDGNRAARKKLDREHIWEASAMGQMIKLADLISNTHSIVERDPEFAKVYLEEKRLLLEGMDRDLPLWRDAWYLTQQGSRIVTALPSSTPQMASGPTQITEDAYRGGK